MIRRLGIFLFCAVIVTAAAAVSFAQNSTGAAADTAAPAAQPAGTVDDSFDNAFDTSF